jgi:hypothetical protein
VNEKMLKEGNQLHYFTSNSGSGTIIKYGSDFLTSYSSGFGSASQKVTVPMVPVPVPVPPLQKWKSLTILINNRH